MTILPKNVSFIYFFLQSQSTFEQNFKTYFLPNTFSKILLELKNGLQLNLDYDNNTLYKLCFKKKIIQHNSFLILYFYESKSYFSPVPYINFVNQIIHTEVFTLYNQVNSNQFDSGHTLFSRIICNQTKSGDISQFLRKLTQLRFTIQNKNYLFLKQFQQFQDIPILQFLKTLQKGWILLELLIRKTKNLIHFQWLIIIKIWKRIQ
ncbi:unnamed protein product [Paramecium sonneborni]|uniref:Uncharacterized protein n=1 Tax=Paramecium sonneborni TaxID=65129 RepID=A0A8S1R6G0_9CILI|nr:unnamed protein product [Paramecium sonneborni]